MEIFNVLCPGVHLLTDDVRNNKSFMTCVQASEQSLLYFTRLKERYFAKQRRERNSKLKKSLDEIEVTINAIKTQIKEASKMNIDPSIGIDRLARTCVQKQELLTRIGQSLVALKTKVSSGDLLNNIRRRIKQQTEAITEETNVICYHMPDYTWEMAFRKLEDQQNSGLSSFPLQDSDLRSVILSLCM